MKVFGPVARTFEHAVYTTFLSCTNERVAFTASLTQHGFQDAEGLTKALDEEVVKTFVSVRNAAAEQRGK
jgi:hypothetical protein